MGEVIYSASPLQAFLWAFATIGFIVVLGVAGLMMGFLRRRKKMPARAGMALLGIFLCLVGAAMAFVTYRSMTGGARTIAVHLNDKQIATDNCGDGGTCRRYVLETQAESKFYDLNVTETTYEKAQVDSCYSVTYYPGKGLLGEPSYADSYESVSNITRIETAACQ